MVTTKSDLFNVHIAKMDTFNQDLFDANYTIEFNGQIIPIKQSIQAIPQANYKRFNIDCRETYNNGHTQSGFIFIVEENGKLSGKVLTDVYEFRTEYRKLTKREINKILDSRKKITY